MRLYYPQSTSIMNKHSYVVSIAESIRDESVGHLVVKARYFFGSDGYALLDAGSSLSTYARVGRKLKGVTVRIDPLEVSWINDGVVIRNFEIQLVEGRLR